MIQTERQSRADKLHAGWDLREFCDGLGLPERKLLHIATQSDALYNVYPLLQGSKKRWIEAPTSTLKRVQRQLLTCLLYQAQPTDSAHGFVAGRSIVSNAEQHVGNDWVVTLDLKDFFPSVQASAVDRSLEGLLPDPLVRKLVVQLTTRSGRLPQGAPTSPHLANLAARPLDNQLSALAHEGGWCYTRYADDLTFSGAGDPRELLPSVRSVVRRHAFRMAEHKTQIRSRHQRQVVTGLVVNERVRLPKPLRRRLRAMLHRAKHDASLSMEDPQAQIVAGHLSFAAFVDPETHEHECVRLRQLLRGRAVATVSAQEEEYSAA